MALEVADVTVREDIEFKRALNRGGDIDQMQTVSQNAVNDMAAVYTLVFGEEYRRIYA